VRSASSPTDSTLRAAFLLLALFIPFSIAGANFALGLGALAWIAHTVQHARRTRSLPRPDALWVAALLLTLSALPSALTSEDTARALKDWKSYWQLLIVFLVGAHIARVGIRERAVAVLAVSSAVACLVAFVQRAGGIHLGPIDIGAEHRVGGTLYTMTFAGVLCQLVVMNAALVARPVASRARLWLLAVTVLQFTALMLTMTRGAWIAVFVGLITVCILLRSRALALATALALAVLTVFTFVYAKDQGRTIAVTEMATEAADRNVSTRLVLWDMSWEMFLDHPWTGVGMGDYSIEANQRLADRTVRTTVDSHNVYLQVLATRGLLGFVPFVAFWVVLVVSLAGILRRAEPGSLARAYAAGALGVVAAILAGALTENNIDDSEVFIAFMFLMGLARSAARDPGAVSPQ